MAEILIEWDQDYTGDMSFKVTVSEGESKTTHFVTLTRGHYDRLASHIDPEKLIRKSFEFLLEREPKESIMEQFELTDIARYFPSYEKEIRWRIRD
ncbi:MAG TPA: hypothetical protein VMR52_08325 [Dehalococcoidia bacterium]|nr:hypothetical protein [Dehalococcoidia bacterium]